MHNIALLLACFLGTGHGRRVRSSVVAMPGRKSAQSRKLSKTFGRAAAEALEAESRVSRGTINALKMLAASLLAFNPADASKLLRLTARTDLGNPTFVAGSTRTVSQRRKPPGRHVPFTIMSDEVASLDQWKLRGQELMQKLDAYEAEGAELLQKPVPDSRLHDRAEVQDLKVKLKALGEEFETVVERLQKHEASTPRKEELDATKTATSNSTYNTSFFNATWNSGYSYLYQQMMMLEDVHRTESYMKSFRDNADVLEGKTVLDVGAGTGVLSIFAAQAGARKVYAVEATDMAKRAKRIIEANGLSDKISVLHSSLECVELPEKVDIIVSEWMGLFLLRESMYDSVLLARDRWLKEDGAMFPSHATLYIAPVGDFNNLTSQQDAYEYEESYWRRFERLMTETYALDYSCVKDVFLQEQHKSQIQRSFSTKMETDVLCGIGQPFLHMDMKTIPVDYLQSPPKDPCMCTLKIERDGLVNGFCGYFDTDFKGSSGVPLTNKIRLTTEPPNGSAGNHTHWGHQAFVLYPPLECKKDDTIECSILPLRQADKYGLLLLECEFTLRRGGRIQDSPIKRTYYVN